MVYLTALASLASGLPMVLLDVNPLFYAVAVFGVLLTGISKSGFSGGVGTLTVPILAIMISPVAAAAIMLPILCLMDVLTIWSYRGRWDRRNLLLLLPGAAVGIGIGWLTFDHVSEDAVRLILGAISLLFGLHYFVGRAAARAQRPGNPVVGVICGTVAGITSFVAHAGGPPVQFFLLPQRMDKTVFVGTNVVFFFLVNLVKLVPYAWLGQFAAQNLTTSLILAPVAPLGVWLGLRLHRLVSQQLFYRISYAAMIVAGVKLLWDGIAGSLG